MISLLHTWPSIDPPGKKSGAQRSKSNLKGSGMKQDPESGCSLPRHDRRESAMSIDDDSLENTMGETARAMHQPENVGSTEHIQARQFTQAQAQAMHQPENVGSMEQVTHDQTHHVGARPGERMSMLNQRLIPEHSSVAARDPQDHATAAGKDDFAAIDGLISTVEESIVEGRAILGMHNPGQGQLIQHPDDKLQTPDDDEWQTPDDDYQRGSGKKKRTSDAMDTEYRVGREKTFVSIDDPRVLFNELPVVIRQYINNTCNGPDESKACMFLYLNNLVSLLTEAQHKHLLQHKRNVDRFAALKDFLRGRYYSNTGNADEAVKAVERALENTKYCTHLK